MSNLIDALCCTQDHPLNGRLPERSGLCRIIWVKKGSGLLLIDLERFAIERDTVFLLQPGQMYLLQAAEDIVGYSFNFPTDLLKKFGNCKRIHPATGQHTEIDDMLQLMLDEQKRWHAINVQMPEEMTEVLFIYLIRLHPVRADGLPFADPSGFAGKFLQLLRGNAATRKKVSDFASELAITPNHLNQIMKRASGFSVKYHIQQQLLLEAKRRMVYSGLGSKQVAHCLGFDDAAHFSKFFKRCAGMTFMAFKHSITEQIHCNYD